MDQYFSQCFSINETPIVVHVSGSPGSGKTWLVETLKEQMPDLYAVDTDEILEDHDPLVIKMRTFKQETQEFVEAWKIAVRANVQRQIEIAIQNKYRCIVLAGILNNMGGPLGGIVDINDMVIYKYFLVPPLPTLLRRFYGRLSTVENGDEFWDGVASGIYPIPSSKKYIKLHNSEKEWHVSHGYILSESQEKIIEEIKKLCNRNKN